MFLLLVQSATLYTKAHINRWWMFLLEFFVLLHGTLVAIDNQNGMWPMFAFGFGFMTIAVQLYSLPLNKKIRGFLQIVYIILVIIVYSGGLDSNRSLTDITEIINIPVIDYLVLFILIIVISIIVLFKKIFSKGKK